VPSGFALRSFVEFGVDPGKLHRIPYGVNLDRFTRIAPRGSKFRILFVGQLGVRKGIGYLLTAFRRAALPGATLVLAGARNAETAMLLGNATMADVEFTGVLTRDQIALEMSRASVLVLPSIEEGLAMVQGQAMACGCPIIATVNAGAEDLFTHGKEGFIVPIRDPDAIATALTKLHQDRELLQSMSEAALQRARHIGGWDQYGAQAIALFQSLLNAGNSPRSSNGGGIAAG
jgi:glycosyltransferase involved in cell wall biosynthesis